MAADGAKVRERRLGGEGSQDSALLAQLSGWWVVLRGQGPIAVVQLLSLLLLLNWRCKNHALNAGAGARWFQAPHFPPTPVLTKKKLCCLTWTHFVYSVAGIFLNPTLGFAALLFLGSSGGAAAPWWPSRTPSPCSSGGTQPQLCPSTGSPICHHLLCAFLSRFVVTWYLYWQWVLKIYMCFGFHRDFVSFWSFLELCYSVLSMRINPDCVDGKSSKGSSQMNGKTCKHQRFGGRQ